MYEGDGVIRTASGSYDPDAYKPKPGGREVQDPPLKQEVTVFQGDQQAPPAQQPNGTVAG